MPVAVPAFEKILSPQKSHVVRSGALIAGKIALKQPLRAPFKSDF
jgi:hypothetical protein